MRQMAFWAKADDLSTQILGISICRFEGCEDIVQHA